MVSIPHNTVENNFRIPSIQPHVSLQVLSYRPAGHGPFGVVVAGADIVSGLEELKLSVHSWVASGWCALLFDFRGFRASGGNPHVSSPSMQVDDYLSVIRWARSRPIHNPTEIVIMGTHSSGLPVAELALEARKHHILGAMAQCPLLDGCSPLMASQSKPYLLLCAGVDYLRSKVGLEPINCDTGSPTPSVASLQSLAPRTFWELFKTRPATHLGDTQCPFLIILAENSDDDLASTTRTAVEHARGRVGLITTLDFHTNAGISQSQREFDIISQAQSTFLRALREMENGLQPQESPTHILFSRLRVHPITPFAITHRDIRF